MSKKQELIAEKFLIMDADNMELEYQATSMKDATDELDAITDSAPGDMEDDDEVTYAIYKLVREVTVIKKVEKKVTNVR